MFPPRLPAPAATLRVCLRSGGFDAGLQRSAARGARGEALTIALFRMTGALNRRAEQARREVLGEDYPA